MAKKAFLETVRTEKAPLRIIRQIRTAILDGELKPGDKLPTEQEMLSHFGVSRHTVREALRALEIMGLLEIRAGNNGGAFVTEVGLETTQSNLINFFKFQDLSIGHISEIRKVLEPYSAKVAAERMTEENLAVLIDIHKRSIAAFKENDYKTLVYMGVQFHRQIALCSHNPILILVLGFVENLLVDVKKVTLPGLEFSKHVVESHQEILDALKNRDAQTAEAAIYNDVANVEDGLIELAGDNSLLTARDLETNLSILLKDTPGED